MTNEAQYYAQRKHDRNLMDYGAESLREDWFKQAIFKQPVYAPADRVGMIMNTFNDLTNAYFEHARRVTTPQKLLVSRQLYVTITKMPGFNEQTNYLHFFQPDQLTADYKPQLSEPDQNVYVQIDPTRTENEYLFQ